MAGPNYGLAKGFKAGGAIRQFRFVELGASEVVTEVDAASVAALGVCQDSISAEDATSGRIANIQLEGIARCIAGAAITFVAGGGGVPVRVDNQGRVVALAAATANQNVVGRVFMGADAAGDHIDVHLTPGVQNTTS